MSYRPLKTIKNVFGLGSTVFVTFFIHLATCGGGFLGGCLLVMAGWTPKSRLGTLQSGGHLSPNFVQSLSKICDFSSKMDELWINSVLVYKNF